MREEATLGPVLYTGVALRSLALLVDVAVLTVYWAVLLLGPFKALNGPPLAALLFVGPALYFLVAWGSFSTTIGMRLLRLRIVRAADGAPIDYRIATVRWLVFRVSVAFCVVIVGVGPVVLPMLVDRRRRAIHDHVAGTVVVRPMGRNRQPPA